MEPLGDWVHIAPWKSRQVLLIAITGGIAESSSGVSGKRRIIRDGIAESALLIAVWSGQWSTMAREFGTGDHEAVLGWLG